MTSEGTTIVARKGERYRMKGRKTHLRSLRHDFRRILHNHLHMRERARNVHSRVAFAAADVDYCGTLGCGMPWVYCRGVSELLQSELESLHTFREHSATTDAAQASHRLRESL